MSVTIGVVMVPGQTALIRIPRGAYSRAALLVRPRTPCLVAWFGGPAGIADESAEGGAVDDRAAALGAHLGELVLHAGPHAAQVDRGQPVERFRRFVGGVADRELDAGVVERHVKAAERVDRSGDHRGDLVLVGDIAPHPEHLMPGCRQLVGDRRQRRLVDVGQHDGGPGFGERTGGGQTHA